jgi:DNA-binding PadR family transcriptional regulator
MPQDAAYTPSRSPEYALLGFLAVEPAHGYDLHQRLIADLGQVWHASQSQTYAILARLETQGLICSTVVRQARLPARRLLELTPAGRAQFDAWLAAPTGASMRAIRVDFITRLYFAARLHPEMAPGMVEEEINTARAGLHALQANLAAVPATQRFNRLALELRIRQLAAVIDWLATCTDTDRQGGTHATPVPLAVP